MTLQAGRYLISCYREAKAGKKQASGVAYLNQLPELLEYRCLASNASEMRDLNIIGQAYSVVAANVVKKAGEDFETCLKRGLGDDDAYEQCCNLFI